MSLKRNAAIIASGLAIAVGTGEMGRKVGQDGAESYLATSFRTEHDYHVAQSIVETSIRVDMGVGLFIWLASMGIMALEPIAKPQD
jgi:hypothetical protein